MIKRPLESQDQLLYLTPPTLSIILTPSGATSQPLQNCQTLQWFLSPLYTVSSVYPSSYTVSSVYPSSYTVTSVYPSSYIVSSVHPSSYIVLSVYPSSFTVLSVH